MPASSSPRRPLTLTSSPSSSSPLAPPSPRHAALVFSALPTSPNLIAWNCLIRTFTLHGRLHALSLADFRRLLDAGSPTPDEFTFTSVIKACAGLLSAPDCEMSHASLFKHVFQSNLFVQNSLVDMYFKFGRPCEAGKLFDEMAVRDVVSWNTLISGLSTSGDVRAVRDVFDRMPEKILVSWSAMIAGHAKAGDLGAARELFDGASERNVVCWNAMIAGYAQNEKFTEAIALFRRMLQLVEAQPNETTLVSVLSACGHLGPLDLGRWIERFIKRRAMKLGLFVGNALSDMYSKCGCIDEARRVFDMMQEKDVISWSIIIAGSAMHGHVEEAITCFDEMLRCGVRPNDITFMGVLSACTHAGLVDEGMEYFHNMSKQFGIAPKVERYGCVVDLLSRAGRLEEAEDTINSMQVAPNTIVWCALLGGCRIYKDVSRGERVVWRILELDPEHSCSYAYLAIVYTSMGRLDDAAKFRSMMQDGRLAKMPGCSWIEIDNMVHE